MRHASLLAVFAALTACLAYLRVPVDALPSSNLPIAIRPDTGVPARRASERVMGRIRDVSGRVRTGESVVDTDRLVFTNRAIDADSGASFLFVARGSNAVVRVTGPARFLASRKDRVNLERGRALAAVRSGTRFQLSAATLVAGVRGTVFYTETDSTGGSYICVCHGSVSVTVPGESTTVTSETHEARRYRPDGRLEPAPMIGHTDADVERILKDLR